MKTSGLLCRADQACEAVFSPNDQKSLESLLQAAARRDAHELQAHDYRHRPAVQHGPIFGAGPRGPRGRRRQSTDEPTLENTRDPFARREG